MSDNKINFYKGTKEKFESIEKDPNSLYYTEDTEEIFKGETKLGGAY